MPAICDGTTTKVSVRRRRGEEVAYQERCLQDDDDRVEEPGKSMVLARVGELGSMVSLASESGGGWASRVRCWRSNLGTTLARDH